MRSCMLLASLALGVSNIAFASASGSGFSEIRDGKMTIQFHTEKDKSQGSFYLRSLLEKAGFKNENHTVKTDDALAPLEISDYLYDDGHYVFTLIVPVESDPFVAYQANGFIDIHGLAASKLFDLVKKLLPRTDLNNLEQYKWPGGNGCDRTTYEEPASYRCWINF